jgi:phosphate transport system permease protein
MASRFTSCNSIFVWRYPHRDYYWHGKSLGETAPIITVGALTFIAFLPPTPLTSVAPFISFEWLQSGFTVLPIQMFSWLSRPEHAFHINAAAAGAVVIILTLVMNGTAIWLRYRIRKNIKW